MNTRLKEGLMSLGVTLMAVYAIGTLVMTADCEKREKGGYVICSLYSLTWPVTLPIAYWESR